jgi:hexosaminidase
MISRYTFTTLFLVMMMANPFNGLQAQNNDYNVVIPAPVSSIRNSGVCTFKDKITIGYSAKELEFVAGFLKDFITSLTKQNVQGQYSNKPQPAGSVVLLIDPSIPQDEGYRLQIDKHRITIQGKNPKGVFYGVQTLVQILYANTDNGRITSLPCQEIVDYPRFAWRGLHLDVSRHFFGTEYVKKYIDIIASLKMNTFHWHLVDDQGWRIEIKKYPKLTEVGAWRVDHEDMPWNDRPKQMPGEKATVGGFYTQEEIKEIVAYAAERFITIVPEIEMPAHVSSALAAYPEYSCRQVPLTVPSGGIWPCVNIYCAGNDSTFLFIRDVLTEVMDLFPSKYIHVGGDEADKTEWKQCPKCQARIRNEKLKDEEELQSYFIRQIDKFLTEKGRILIGWDEILQGGLADNATVMSWRGTEGGIHAASMRHNVVMTPVSHCYLDYYQSHDIGIEPLAIGGYISLEQIYSFEPVPEVLNTDESKYIIGAQGNVWTEYIPVFSHVEYMLLPRALALAEVDWSPASARNYPDFLGRLENQLNMLSSQGINYYVPSVEGLPDTTNFTEAAQVTLVNPYPFGEILYTTDGTDPVPASTKYSGPLSVQSNTIIKAAIFLRNGRYSKVKTGKYFRQ